MLENLKRLREAANLSQKALADVIGVSQQSINKYENHNIEPDIETMMRLADYFNTSVDYLIGHTDIPHRIEPVRPWDLNEREARALEGYRRLTEKQRRSVELIIEAFLGE